MAIFYDLSSKEVDAIQFCVDRDTANFSIKGLRQDVEATYCKISFTGGAKDATSAPRHMYDKRRP